MSSSVVRCLPAATMVAITALGITSGVGPAGAATGGASSGIVAEDYDLGVKTFPQPGLPGKFARMPIRLWGAISAPSSPGPHPVVVVIHGQHGDNCPGEYARWPCWDVEKRSDLGFRYLVRALARAGFIAVAPDVNAARTGGWGEGSGTFQKLRIAQVIDSTLAAIGRASTGGETKFTIPLSADLSRVGALGHSQGGPDALEWARGKQFVRSMFLLAPFDDPSKRIGNVPSTTLLGTCDFDTGLRGAVYFDALRRQQHSASAFLVTVSGANHNFYNQTLVVGKEDDARGNTRSGCQGAQRMSASEQQSFLVKIASDHFRSSALGRPRSAWMKTPAPKRLYGQHVTVRQRSVRQ